MDVLCFKRILKEKGLTNAYIAHILGIDQSTLYRKLAAGGDSFTIGEINSMVKKIPLDKDDAIKIFLA